MKHALIVGISGIIGQTLAKYLLLAGDWKVSGIGRKDYPNLPEKINVIKCDLLDFQSVKQCTNNPQLASVTHIFYTAWIGRGSDDQQVTDNRTMFANVLEIGGKATNLKFIYLQTGTKYYGMHIGPSSGLITPCREDLPRLKAPIFYYPQEDMLKKFGEEHKTVKWVVARPPNIIGYAMGNAMNFAQSLAVYACILKEEGKPLVFPYDEKCFNALREFVDYHLVCRFAIWAACNPEIPHGEAFNITNGDLYRCDQLWDSFAKYFGMNWKMADKPFNVVDYMKEKAPVWDRIVQKYNLCKYPIEQASTPSFLHMVLGRNWDDCCSTLKVNKYGFRATHLDTVHSFVNFFDTLKLNNVIPTYE